MHVYLLTLQTIMSVTLTMEAVTRDAPTRLVPMSAHALMAMSSLVTVTLVLVSNAATACHDLCIVVSTLITFIKILPPLLF